MGKYRYNGKKGQFHVVAGPNQEQALLDRIRLGTNNHMFTAILVDAVLTQDGEPVQHRTLHILRRNRDWVGHEPWQVNAEAEVEMGDELLDDVVLPAPVDALGLPLYEYKVCLQFKEAFANRPRDWPLRLLNDVPSEPLGPPGPLVLACTPLTASTREEAVEMMTSTHCRSWGYFTLDDATLTMLLQHRYDSLLDEPEVVETIARHVPPKRMADVEYQRRVLSMWKKNFPEERDRLQPRRCDAALHTPARHARPAYTKGWQQWMAVNIDAPKEQLFANAPPSRPLVLIAPPTLEKTDWAKSHGPHVYMHDRLDLALLHDCLADGHARYIVLDEIPWPLLLSEEGHAHSILTNATFQWYRGSRVYTTVQRLPVIVLNSHLPDPADARWAPRGWEHWQTILQWVKLLPYVPLFKPAITTNNGGEDVSCTAGHKQSPVWPPTTCPSPATADLIELASQLTTANNTSKDELSSGKPVVHHEGTAQGLFDGHTAPETTCPSPVSEDIIELASQLASPATEEKGPPLKLDMQERVSFGPDSFLYPNAIPLQHRDRLLHVVEAMDYVQMKYRGRDLARQKAFQSDNIAGSYAFYEYTGSVPDVWYQGDWSPECLEMRDALRQATQEPVNSMVGNQYLDRHARIDHHSDKTPDIQRGTSIWTISLGDTRLFELRKLDLSETLKVQLMHGSLFQIGPLTNAAYTHSIPQMPHDVGPRYGLTFRTLASRWLHEEQLALRQPAEDGEPWLVQRKAAQLDADGQVVAREQDGYPSRRVVHLPPFALVDSSHVQEEDIVRLRQLLQNVERPSVKRTAKALEQERRTRKRRQHQ